MQEEFTIISTWDEINKYILDQYNLTNNKKLLIRNTKKSGLKYNFKYKNVYTRLNHKLYNNLNNNSIYNTIKYIFYKIRAGIYVEIKNNKLHNFVPFANKYFVNNWYKNIKLYSEEDNNTINNFLKTKKKYYKYYKKYITNPKYWWANAYIVNNEKRDDIWGQHSLLEYYNILIYTLKNHKVNNCKFIINKRDHPILNKNLYEPFLNFYKNKETKIEPKYRYNNYIPILSPYTNENYLDIPFIIPEDWKLANNDKTYYNIQEEIKWEDKIPIAIFRGSATGSIELEYNQRLQISKLDNEWKITKPGLIDAGIVSWNSRDKIDSHYYINYIKPQEMNKMGIFLKEKIPMNEQIKYKYILNIDGHSKPNRTSYLLQSSSLMLVVESKYVIGNICWYSELLKPFIHYIPIKYDLSDLEEKIIWCRNNDEKCKLIVQNAKQLYNDYLTKEKILYYSAYVLNNIANNF